MVTGWIRLRGRDYPLLGPVGAASLPGIGALALSRGLYAKPYAHVDPNEDGALLVASAPGRLLAIVDGHRGVHASELALDHLLGQADALLRGDFAPTIEALVREISRQLPDKPGSRTALLVVALRDRRCSFASFGDAALYRAGASEPLCPPNDLFLGPDLRVHVLPPALWLGEVELDPGERIALVTDGVTNFHPNPEGIAETLRAYADEEAAALGLLIRAMRAGAGDNVAAAVATAG